MPTNHPRYEVKTTNVEAAGLKGINLLAAIALDLGAAHRDELFDCVDEETFWKEYFPSMTVDGQQIPLSPQRRPVPGVIARYQCDKPSSDWKVLEEFIGWLAVATSRQVPAVMNLVRS